MSRSGDLQFEWTRVHLHAARSDSEWVLERNESAVDKSVYKWNARKIKKGLFGDTALHIAAFQGDFKTVEELAFSVQDLNVFNSYGWTPLHCAVASGNTRVAKLLISRGADPAAMDAKRKVSLQNVAQGEEMLKLLQKAMAGGIQVFSQSKKIEPGVVTEPSEVDKDKLLSAGYYLLKCLDSMGNVSDTDQFKTALKVLFYKSWKRYCSGEKQLDRILAMLNQCFVSAWKPKTDGSMVANSLLSYSCTEKKRSWERLEIKYSTHPKRIGHCWPVFECPMLPRCAVIVKISAEMSRFPARPGKDSSSLRTNQFMESVNGGSTLKVISGEASHVTASHWVIALCKTFELVISRIRRLAARKHAVLTTKVKGREFTRVEMISRRILKFMQTLCSPGYTMIMDMKPSYSRPFDCEDNADLTQSPKNFPSGPGLLENFGSRYMHIWSWMIGLGTTPYPPRLPSLAQPGDHPPKSLEYDPLDWLEMMSECLSKYVPGFQQEPLLRYMLSPMWRPKLARVNLEIPGLVASAPGHAGGQDEHPFFYATALSFPLPPFCQSAPLFYLPSTSRLDVADSIFSPFMELVYAISDEQNPKLIQTLPSIEVSAARGGKSPHKSAAIAKNGEARDVSPAKMRQAVRLSGTLWVDNTDDTMGNLARHWASRAALLPATSAGTDSDTDGYGSSSASP